MRGERGITLVALVVTIVVLLILAGITITYVLADDGIFGKAQQAATDTIVGEIKDHVSMALLNAKAEAVLASVEGTTYDATTAQTLIANAMPSNKGKFGAITVTISAATKDAITGTITIPYGDDAEEYSVSITDYTTFTVTPPADGSTT